jgi:Zn-dependent peptidase ImmA (M78 family)
MQIKFMSQTWTIRDAEPRELPESTLGLCDPKTNTIIIEATLTDWPRLQTIFHELFHVWEMTMNQGLTEQQVDTMAAALIHCLHENPELIKMIELQE